MEQTDILYHIASQVNDQVLLALFPAFGTQIRKLANDNGFWYVRSQYLVSPRPLAPRDANWSKIYYALLAERSTSPRIRLQYGLDYLPSLLALEEVYGASGWTGHDWKSILRFVSSPEVLSYITANSVLRHPTIAYGMKTAAKNGWTQMIEPYLAMIGNRTSRAIVVDLEGVCHIAITREHTGTCDLLVDLMLRDRLEVTSEEKYNLLFEAIENGSRNIIASILRLYLYREQARSDVLLILPSATSEALEALVDMSLVTIYEIHYAYIQALQDGHPGIVEFVLSRHLEPDPNWEEELKKQLVAHPSTSYIKYLLLKTNPAANDYLPIRLVLDRTPVMREILALLLSDPRVEIEDMSPHLITSLYCAMGTEASINILCTDLYSIVQRHIIIKSPSNDELLDWMIRRRYPKFQVVAEAVLQDEWEMQFELIPVQALLRVILYPTLPLSELMEEMCELKMDERIVAQSIRLCSSQLKDDNIAMRELHLL